MDLEDEIEAFAKEILFLSEFKKTIYALNFEEDREWQKAQFLAEAVTFRLYRAQERFIRAIFLNTCVVRTSYLGQPVISRLTCPDTETAEAILKASAVKFLDWGNPQQTTQRASLVFENGFPITDTIGPLHSSLVSLQRIRNYIAHDSREASSGFQKAIQGFLSPGSTITTAGQLLLSRRRRRQSYVLSQLVNNVAALRTTYLQI